MIRLSKLADYGIVLMTYLARDSVAPVHTARGLAERARLPYPTVSKIMKAFSRAGLVVAQRGKQGGYALARESRAISVLDVLSAIDGPVTLTECDAHAPGLCELETTCPVRGNWAIISCTVREALQKLTLDQMTAPLANSQHAALRLVR